MTERRGVGRWGINFITLDIYIYIALLSLATVIYPCIHIRKYNNTSHVGMVREAFPPPKKFTIIHSCVGKYHHSINSAIAWNVIITCTDPYPAVKVNWSPTLMNVKIQLHLSSPPNRWNPSMYHWSCKLLVIDMNINIPIERLVTPPLPSVVYQSWHLLL